MVPALRTPVAVCLPGSLFSAGARTRTCDGVPVGAHPWNGSVDRSTIRSRSKWTRCAFHPWLAFPRPSSMRWPSGHPKRAFGLVLNLPHRPAPPPAPPTVPRGIHVVPPDRPLTRGRARRHTKPVLPSLFSRAHVRHVRVATSAPTRAEVAAGHAARVCAAPPARCARDRPQEPRKRAGKEREARG